jgi:hypothetical protein
MGLFDKLRSAASSTVNRARTAVTNTVTNTVKTVNRTAETARSVVNSGVSEFVRTAKKPVELAAPVAHRLLNGSVAVANYQVTQARDLARTLYNGGKDLVSGAGRLVDGAKTTAHDAARLLLSDPGAAAEKPIGNRQNLTGLDKAVINAAGFDKMTPGQKTTVQISASAEVAAILGVDVGAKVNVSVERRTDDPNKFKITLGGGGSVAGKVTGDTAGAEANAKLGLEASAGIELTVDLSKPGAATELAAFAAQTGAMAGIASLPGVGPAAAAVLTGIQELPGVNLPGEPLDYIRRHVSALEVGVGGKLTGLLGGTLGAGVEGQVAPYLKYGGKVEFNENGTLTVRANVAGGVEGEIKGAAGGGGVQATMRLAGGQAEVAFEQNLVIKPGTPPKILSEGYKATLTLQGDAATQGGQLKMEVAVDQLPPALKERVLGKLLRGDTQGASDLIGQAMKEGQLSASFSASSLANYTGGLQVKPAAGGAVAGGELGASVTNELPVASGSVTITATGIKLQASAFGYPAGTELTWAQVRELTNRLTPALRN